MKRMHGGSSRPSAAWALCGGLLGGGAWAALAFGLPAACGTQAWLGHVFSSWVNAFSMVAFGAALAQLMQRRAWITGNCEGMELGLLGLDEDTLLLPDDVKTARKKLPEVPEKLRRSLPVRLLTVGLLRARAHWSATDVSAAIQAEADLAQEETSTYYSNIRYLAWAIPSIGFIGTVLGIGWAMGDLTMLGDDQGQSMATAGEHLSVAFDTTFVALAASLMLMYVMQHVEAMDDRLLVEAKGWCLRQLPLRMHMVQEK